MEHDMAIGTETPDGETVAELLAVHRAEPRAIIDTVRRSYARLAAAADPALLISLRPEAEVVAEAEVLVRSGDRKAALFGIPVAIKDNIDVAGLATTAGCPAFAYNPKHDAQAVARLRRAGALVIGKTNLDQFATGLVGVRSPYGTPRNAIHPDLVPGGSSSGSAVVVARGIVPLALGTDTAGSGRVPAGLNNIVGLKPTLGVISTEGVVPACRSLDCVSIFALTAGDAIHAFNVLREPDMRTMLTGDLQSSGRLRLGVPCAADRRHFGDRYADAAFDVAVGRARTLGWQIIEVDLTACFEAAALLYDGPWVAERTTAVGEFVRANPDACHPVTRTIIDAGWKYSAVDLFRGFEKLAALKANAFAVFSKVDALMVPTAPSAYTTAEVAADPIALNARLGTYTNFVNFFDMAGMAVPSTIDATGRPAGVTFLGKAGQDASLAEIGGRYHAATGLRLGALAGTHVPVMSSGTNDGQRAESRPSRIEIAVVGAHLSGMPLNHELVSLRGQLVAAATTTADYRLFALPGTVPPKPGMLRVAPGRGAAVEIEIWSLDPAAFGTFVAAVPAPLSIGSVRIADGRLIKGFLVESESIQGARDVSEYGGWRAAQKALATRQPDVITKQ
jgi:allophanate hydrolase